MSASNDGCAPQPVPRRSRSTSLPQHKAQIDNGKIATSSSGTGLGSSECAIDNVKMNAEICRYREALKGGPRNPPRPDSSVSPRPPVAHTASNDTDNNIDLLRKQLHDVMDKNNQWQVYDCQRESYVKSLHQKYHELHCRYQELNATHLRITSNPSMLAEQQRQYFDKLLIQAKQERESYESEIARLKASMESMRVEVMEELKNARNEMKYWKALYENEIKKQWDVLKKRIPQSQGKVSNGDKENWDRISSLQRELEMQRKDFSVEQSRRESIERQLENVQKQLKCKESTRIKSREHQISQSPIQELRSKSKSMKCTDKSRSPQKVMKLSKEEKHALQNDRRSHPIELSHVTIRKSRTANASHGVDDDTERLNHTYSEFGHNSDSYLSCPSCGKIYAFDEHEFLLSHIDLCL